MDEKQRINNECPYERANILSKIFMSWVTPLLKLGQRKIIEEEDLYKPLKDDTCLKLTRKLENNDDVLLREWNKEKTKNKPSLLAAIFRLYALRYLILALFPITNEALRLIQPLCIAGLLKYFNGELELKWALIYATSICLIIAFCVFLQNSPYLFLIVRSGMQIRIAVSGLIYNKTLKLHLNGGDGNLSGKLLNMLSADCSDIERSLHSVAFFLVAPLHAIAALVLLINYVDYTALSGFIVFATVVPFQTVLAHFIRTFRANTLKEKDQRIGLLNQIVNGIKIIKTYCWEQPFMKIVNKIRKKELGHQRKTFAVYSLNTTLDRTVEMLITFVIITVFIHFTNKPLLPAYIVIIMGYYMRLSTTIGHQIVKALNQLVNATVSVKRIQEYLLREELPMDNKWSTTNDKPCIQLKDFCASLKQETNSFSLQNISFNIKEKGLLAVVGQIGAGKTTLLMSLIGEIPKTSGDIKINGRMFYVSQEPWIFPATLKQNILFGKPYDKQKFNEIIKVSCLIQDIKELPNGINTIIGDKGVNLSGGQRARVNLARALYNDPDIYLFDDPLSAVDANVGKKLYDRCINGYLKNKIRVLVTHQVHHLTNADEIIALNNGEVLSQGKFDEVSVSINLNRLLETKDEKDKNQHFVHEPLIDDNLLNKEDLDTNIASSMLSLVSHDTDLDYLEESDETETKDSEFMEKKEKGKIKCQVYCGIFNLVLNILIPSCVLMLFVLSHGSTMVADYFLTSWANKEEKLVFNIEHCRKIEELLISNNTECHWLNATVLNQTSSNALFKQVSAGFRSNYYLIYLAMIGTGFILCVTRGLVYFEFCLIASKILHKKMLKSILQAKLRFFDLNPVGRIMARFAKDMDIIDQSLPETLMDFLVYSCTVIGGFIMPIIVNIWLIIPLIPVLIALVLMRFYFIKTSREIKRIEGLTRSPVYVHSTNTLQGIRTIRASNMQSIFEKEFYTHVDYHTQAHFAFISINRWFAIRLELILCLYTTILIFSSILLNKYISINSSQIGLAIVYCLRQASGFQWCIRQSAEVENLMTAIERVMEYSTINGEDNINKNKKPSPSNWPSKGEVIFENVSLTYDKKLPNALNNLNFRIHSGEKIGVVGRTGAGKSSLFQALLRTGEVSGNIIIDGVDTSQITLQDLRQSISVIPQEPTLFIGSVRYNLDPFNQYNDNSLWNALESVQLKEVIKNMDGGLDAKIESNGSNLSVGQKQLFCLARAILKNSKILIIDEATANVDFQTDELVQLAIRKYFKDCTVITIAHRLHTVIDSDRILCIANGSVSHFDHPYELLQNKESLLYELISKLVDTEKSSLMKLAEKKMLNELL